MSDSVQPHGRQPTSLLCPWDSPGKNTGVGCHFLLQCMKVKVKVKSLSRVQLLTTAWTEAYQAPPSMGFSRQEYWSGVPSPSPINRYTFVHIAFLVTFRVVRVVVSPVFKRILKDQKSKHFLSGLSSSNCVCMRDGHMGAKSTGLWAPVLNSIQQVISSY